MMRKVIYRIVPVVLFLLTGMMNTFAQCPMCKAAVESQDKAGTSALSHGLNTGILYLFVLPYLCVMLVAGVFYWHWRKRKVAKSPSLDAN